MSLVQQLASTIMVADTNPVSDQTGVVGFFQSFGLVIRNIFSDWWRLGTCALLIIIFCSFIKKAMNPGWLKVSIALIGSFVTFWVTYRLYNQAFHNPYPLIPGEPTLSQVVADLSTSTTVGFWVMVISVTLGIIIAVIVKGVLKGILIGVFTAFSLIALYSFIVSPLVTSIYNQFVTA